MTTHITQFNIGRPLVDARLEGATISGVAVTDLLAYWQTGRGAKGA